MKSKKETIELQDKWYKYGWDDCKRKYEEENKRLREIADLAWSFVLDARGSWETNEGEMIIEKYEKLKGAKDE